MSVRWPCLGLSTLLVALTAGGLIAERHRFLVPLRFAIQRQSELMPSTVLAPARDVYRGVPTLSLYVPPGDLYDPATGILANKYGRGRAWERAGTITYFDQARVVFSAAVGVRVHGGGSRTTSRHQSFRLFARRQYGATELPGGVLFGAPHDHPLRRLVVHNDVRLTKRVSWHLVNPLAYDIASAAGCIVSPTRPVRFLLNGEFLGVYVLSEYFDTTDYFEQHLGRPVSFSVADIEQLWRDVQAVRPLRMREVGRLVDLDNITRWFIAVVFCATGDPYQGPGQYLDRVRETAPWFWVTWDLDQSFREPELDSFGYLLERIGERRRGRRGSEPRSYILTTLLAEDEEYRDYFKRLWVDIMNHRVTPALLRARFEHYRQIALRYGIEDVRYLERLEAFIDARPAVVRALAEQWLNTPPSVRCRIGGSGTGVLLDGHPVQPGFEGYYFPGMTLEIGVDPARRPALAYWRVLGRRYEAAGTPLRLKADRDLDVEAVWH